MTDKLIVVPGLARLDLQPLQAVAAEFGWTVNVVHDLPDLADAQADGKTAAVLFHRDAFGVDCSWLEAVRLLKLVVPGVRLVACHGFPEQIDWPRLCDAGAFHALWLPLKQNEIRKSLGFISEAEARGTGVAFPPDRRPLRRLSEIQSARSIGSVDPRVSLEVFAAR